MRDYIFTEDRTKGLKHVAWIAIVALCASCGGTRFNVADPNDQKQSLTFVPPTFVPPAADDDDGGSTTPPEGGTGDLLIDPYVYDVDGLGNGDFCFDVPAEEKLKIKFRPGAQYQTVPGNNFSPIYSYMKLKVKVYDTTRMFSHEIGGTSYDLMGNGVCGDVHESDPIDLSSALVQCGDDCSEMVTVCLTKPRYDYVHLVLMNNGTCALPGTPVATTTIQENHPWVGVATVETEDTKEIE